METRRGSRWSCCSRGGGGGGGQGYEIYTEEFTTNCRDIFEIEYLHRK